jgi:hypothetical protein
MGESFAERWRRKERDCGFGDIASKTVACGADVLPDSAAPCVTFRSFWWHEAAGLEAEAKPGAAPDRGGIS